MIRARGRTIAVDIAVISIVVCVCAGIGRADPPWGKRLTPHYLGFSLEPQRGPGVAGRATKEADFKVARTGAIVIDGKLDEWGEADWQTLDRPPSILGDSYAAKVNIKVPEGATPTDDPSFLGFTYDQMGLDYQRKYSLTDFYDGHGVVVTGVRAGSPAAEAGLREGDVILGWGKDETEWCRQVYLHIRKAMQQAGAQTIKLEVTRSGADLWRGPQDLSARFAFLVDDANLYFAAEVNDDVHYQKAAAGAYWQHDSIQLGFDPMLQRASTRVRFSLGYPEGCHEIGLVSQDGKPFAWRWTGRRGQTKGLMEDVKVAVTRTDGQTIYEAAIPLGELAPLAPDLWPHCGIDVVVNDSDGTAARKQHAELVMGAITHDKNPDLFQEMEFAPSPDRSKVSFAWLYDAPSMWMNGRVRMTIGVCSPTAKTLRLTGKVFSEYVPDAPPATGEIEIPVSPEPKQYWLLGWTGSAPSLWRFEMTAFDPRGRVVAEDIIPLEIRR